MKIGAQLYTLHEQCQTLEGFSEALKRVADIGYTTVQVSGTCAYEPSWLQAELKKNGLQCVITHTKPAELEADAVRVVENHRVFNCRYIGLGSAPGGMDNIDTFIEAYRPIARTIRDNGAYMMYHNHHAEFGRYDEKTLYFDKIIDAFEPDCLGFTLDTYWVQVGGGNPAEWLLKLKNRVPCIHLKDLTIVQGEQRMAPVGSGNINFLPILAAAEAAGTKYLLVEQDFSYGRDPFDELKQSFKYLSSLGLE